MMKTLPIQAESGAFALALVVVIGFGCASPSVNPAAPKAKTGYVDLYSPTNGDLSWDVQHSKAGSKSLKKVFSDVIPVEGGVLRLAFPPGQHHFRITFLNRVITEPAEVDVEVQDAKITPILITFTEAGEISVKTKEQGGGAAGFGRYGRRTNIGSYEAFSYALSATAEKPVAYQVKERMPYAH
jgi:hypothetical protein